MCPIICNFYPRSPCGERHMIHPHLCDVKSNFYPRSPCGERLVNGGVPSSSSEFLSTLSLRRATPSGIPPPIMYKISIHALLAESDLRVLDGSKSSIEISIHALLAESDYDTSSLMQCQAKFLSTLSLRRATADTLTDDVSTGDFYPRSPCGERLELLTKWLSNALFLSTLSLRRATKPMPLIRFSRGIFLSTLSLRRATR